ncbi:MAG: hypothetical protein WCR20_09215 [Verrucomicrobiota bacterium]
MKGLTKQKKQQLLLVGLITAAALAAVWLSLISTQQNTLSEIAVKKAEASKKLEAMGFEIQKADVVESRLTETSQKLGKLEEGMASGDLYSWTINTLRQFKLPYKLDIPHFSQIDGPKDYNQMLNFPYKQASISVGGSAEFLEFGRFVADFENQFPHMRILNLTLEHDAGTSSEGEKLNFKMDILTLVKPSGS